MKRLPLLLICATLMVMSSHAQNPMARATSQKENDLPYKARISSNMQIGDRQYLQMVLNAWKAWDDNKLDAMAMILSDTLTAIFADGSVVRGKDKFMSSGKEYRGSLAASSSILQAATPLKFVDHDNLQVVSVWGTETDTKKDGTKETYDMNEVWAFNKDGQVTYFHQFVSKGQKNQ